MKIVNKYYMNRDINKGIMSLTENKTKDTFAHPIVAIIRKFFPKIKIKRQQLVRPLFKKKSLITCYS